jgi:hypothetical protein
MEVSEGELLQLVSNTTRPVSKNAPKRKRLNILSLLAFFNGFGSACAQRSRTSFSTLDYIPFHNRTAQAAKAASPDAESSQLLIRPERLASCFPTSPAQNAVDMGHPVLILLGRINNKQNPGLRALQSGRAGNAGLKLKITNSETNFPLILPQTAKIMTL